MKPQTLLLLLAVAVAAYLLLKKKDETSAAASAPSPVVQVVAETLHQHEGEDTPIVHAFEEALEQKAKQEETTA